MKKPTWLLIVILMFSTNIFSGDIATEKTQLTTGGLVALLQTATDKIVGLNEEIKKMDKTAQELLDIANLPAVLESAVPELFDALRAIQDTIEQGNALAYSADNLEQFMRDQFGSYDDYLAAIIADGTIDPEKFRNRFREWDNTHRDTIRNIMLSHNLQARQIDTEEARLKTFKELTRSAKGRMQALQVGHQIAIEEISQMHKLRELLMEQSNLHASYFALRQAAKAEVEAATEFFLRRSADEPIIGDAKGYP